MQTVPDAVLAAAAALGGQASLARLLRVSSPTVNQWAKGERPVPIEHCPLISKAVPEVHRWHLRPTDWHRIWPELLDHPDAPAVPAAEPVAAQEGA